MADLHLVPAPIPDSAARAQALDIAQSFLVEAPAGSGKTGLLIQRFLKLLASVDDPRQVLAITFTRKATAEMLERVLAQLRLAQAGFQSQTASPFEVGLQELARAVLARDKQLQWNLLDNPTRLNIRTIDSLSNEIAGALPILSGSGGAQSPTEDATQLHAEAARRTLMLLGGDDPALAEALETLLLHRDGNLANCESLIATMLNTRDQWGELVPLTQSLLTDEYLDETILPRLDHALDLAICRALTSLTRILPASTLSRLTTLAAEMGSLAGYKDSASPIAICAHLFSSPASQSDHLDHWRALIHLIVKPSKPRDFRKSVSANHIGFEILKHHQADLKQIVADLTDIPGLLDALCEIDSLPPPVYPRDQWPVTKSLFRVLARALTELQLVFAERGQCDFTEVGLLARTALRNDAAMDDLAASSGARLQHLLVDEMQDTSSGQYEFIQLLTRGWDGYSQTVFLVGDPKQSIYAFRQARVERFLSTLRSNRLGDLPLTVLHLTANFRSRPALVESFNEDFTHIFSGIEAGSNEISYAAATAIRTGQGQRLWHPRPITHDASVKPTLQATEIRQIIESWRAKPTPATIAVLVRNRSHLIPIVAALKQAAIPYRAVEIDSLAERPEILDLLALTRALLHSADRTAWLALLRSPICGLSLADLYRLAAPNARQTIFEALQTGDADLSDDAIARLQPVWPILNEALQHRGRQTLSEWVAQTWRAFNVPAHLSPDALLNAEAFFQLLDQLQQPGPAVDLARLHERVAKLYAAPSAAPDAVDLMTLHKAKGLEWDVVIVPELHRTGRINESRLLSWLEIEPEDTSDDSIAAGILAPIAGKGKAVQQLNAWMRSVDSAREAAERKRLFYVASTRAREELHLFAAPKRLKSGELKPRTGSLLEAAWTAAQPHFTAEIVAFPTPIETILPAVAASAPSRTIQRIPTIPPALPCSVSPLPSPAFPRPEGSFSARAFGNTLHAFLELLTTHHNPDLASWQPRIAAVLRAAGLSPAEVARLAPDVLRGLTKTVADPEGQWLLAAHPHAETEASYTNDTAMIRLDRAFLAGSEPLSTGSTHLWIVDYKTTTHGAENLEEFLEAQRLHYAPQLENYARTLASQLPIRLALYYPMLPSLLWWKVPDS